MYQRHLAMEAPDMPTGICPQCGQAGRDDARYCARCGAQVHKSPTASNGQPIRRRRGYRGRILIAGFCAAAIGFAFIYREAGLSRSQRRLGSDDSADTNRMLRRFRSSVRENEGDADVLIESIRKTVFEIEDFDAKSGTSISERRFRTRAEDPGSGSNGSPNFREAKPEMAE